MRVSWRITSNKLAAAFALVGLVVGLSPLALQAFGYELSRSQGYVVLAIIGLCVVGLVVALLWPDQKQRERDALGAWRNKIDQWASDKTTP